MQTITALFWALFKAKVCISVAKRSLEKINVEIRDISSKIDIFFHHFLTLMPFPDDLLSSVEHRKETLGKMLGTVSLGNRSCASFLHTMRVHSDQGSHSAQQLCVSLKKDSRAGLVEHKVNCPFNPIMPTVWYFKAYKVPTSKDLASSLLKIYYTPSTLWLIVHTF